MDNKGLVIVFLLSLLLGEIHAQDNFPSNKLLGASCNIKYSKSNDSTLIMSISINGYVFKDSFLLVKAISYSKYIPKYFGKYKNSLLFINGESVNYRCLTVYELKGNAIKKSTYEMELCSNRNSSTEYYLFFYNDQPIKIISYLKKTRYKHLNFDIKINPHKICSIESCYGHFLIKMENDQCYSLR